MTEEPTLKNDACYYVAQAKKEHLEVFRHLSEEKIATAALVIGEAIIYGGHKVIVCGNGGSAADAQHFAAEFTGRMLKERRPLPCIALTTDTSALTAIANDYGYEQVFRRQAEALTQEGDIFLGISTSGNSTNVVDAAVTAKEKGAYVIGLIGNNNYKCALHHVCDLVIDVPSGSTPRIQEAHIFILHSLIDIVDQFILGADGT